MFNLLKEIFFPGWQLILFVIKQAIEKKPRYKLNSLVAVATFFHEAIGNFGFFYNRQLN